MTKKQGVYRPKLSWLLAESFGSERQRSPQSKELKSLRSQMLGDAIRDLRVALGSISQHDLAGKVGGNTTANCVSRWETGKIMPHVRNRKKLAALAEQCGQEELAEWFTQPHDWRAGFRYTQPEWWEFLIILEICGLAAFDRTWDHYEPHLRQLRVVTENLVNLMIDEDRAGNPPLLFDDHHRKVWRELKAARAEKSMEGTKNEKAENEPSR